MSSKFLIRNDEMIFDFRIDSKAFRMINNLQINLKIKHSRKINNLHIDIKNKHHSMIRQYDHAFFLKHFCAVFNCEIFQSKFLLFHENKITSFSSTIRSFFDSTFTNNSWSIISWCKFLKNRVFHQILSSLSTSRKILESI